MVDKKFIELTNKLISLYQELAIDVGNGNVILAKPPVEAVTKGGLHIPDEARELESKLAGFAKVIAIPNNLDPDNGDLNIKPGDYVWFTHVADQPIYRKALEKLGDLQIPKEMLFYTGDNEIIQKISADKVEK